MNSVLHPAPAASPELTQVREELHTLVNHNANLPVLEAVKLLLINSSSVPETDFWDELSPATQEHLRQSLASLDAGEGRDFWEFMDELRQQP